MGPGIPTETRGRSSVFLFCRPAGAQPLSGPAVQAIVAGIGAAKAGPDNRFAIAG